MSAAEVAEQITGVPVKMFLSRAAHLYICDFERACRLSEHVAV
jgi:hypothetical protein